MRLIPTAIQPFKQHAQVAEARHRLAMLSAAVLDREGLVVDDREIVREGISYTVDTLKSLHADFPADQLFLLVGADACRGLPEWHEADRLNDLCTVVELTRAGVEPAGHGMVRVEVPAIDISSTGVRESVAAGQDVSSSVPAAVADYIREHALYQ